MPVRDPELLEPAFLKRLEKLVRVARRAPPPKPERKRRFLSRGKGVEVATFRDYSPGDDVRLIDWAAYARLERFYIRVVEEILEPRLDLLVDASGSMGRGSPEPLRRTVRAAAAARTVRRSGSGEPRPMEPLASTRRSSRGSRISSTTRM